MWRRGVVVSSSPRREELVGPLLTQSIRAALAPQRSPPFQLCIQARISRRRSQAARAVPACRQGGRHRRGRREQLRAQGYAFQGLPRPHGHGVQRDQARSWCRGAFSFRGNGDGAVGEEREPGLRPSDATPHPFSSSCLRPSPSPSPHTLFAWAYSPYSITCAIDEQDCAQSR